MVYIVSVYASHLCMIITKIVININSKANVSKAKSPKDSKLFLF